MNYENFCFEVDDAVLLALHHVENSSEFTVSCRNPKEVGDFLESLGWELVERNNTYCGLVVKDYYVHNSFESGLVVKWNGWTGEVVVYAV